MRPRPRSASTCTTTGSASPPTRGAPATSPIEWLLRGSRGGRDLRGRPRRTRQRHPGAAVDDEGREGRRRLQVHRTEIVRQPDAGLDAARPARDGHERSGDAEDRPRASCRATRKGFTIKDTWDVLGMRATKQRRHDPRGRVRARQVHRAHRAGRRGRRRSSSSSASSPGRSSNFAQRLLRPVATRVKNIVVEHLKTKTSIALTRPMSYHAEVQHGIAEIVLEHRGDRTASRRDRARLVGGCAASRLAGEDRRREVHTLSRAPSRSSTARSTCPAASACSRRASSSGCSAIAAPDDSTRRTRRSRTSSAAKLTLGINPDETPRWG